MLGSGGLLLTTFYANPINSPEYKAEGGDVIALSWTKLFLHHWVEQLFVLTILRPTLQKRPGEGRHVSLWRHFYKLTLSPEAHFNALQINHFCLHQWQWQSFQASHTQESIDRTNCTLGPFDKHKMGNKISYCCASLKNAGAKWYHAQQRRICHLNT